MGEPILALYVVTKVAQTHTPTMFVRDWVIRIRGQQMSRTGSYEEFTELDD